MRNGNINDVAYIFNSLLVGVPVGCVYCAASYLSNGAFGYKISQHCIIFASFVAKPQDG